MRVQKFVAMVAAAAVFVVAPSVVPMKRVQAPVQLASAAPCGVIAWAPMDSASAIPAPIPCPTVIQPTVSAWPVIGGMLAVGSVIVNSIVVSQTQCRELTSQEAVTSLLLPFIGMAFNQNKNMCRPH